MGWNDDFGQYNALVRNSLTQALTSHNQVVVVAGAGVSIAMTPDQVIENVPLASWVGLLLHGVDFCQKHVGADEGWCTRVRDSIRARELHSVADRILEKIRGQAGGDRLLQNWLRASIGSLEPANTKLADALARLDVSIATTNFDLLLEKITGRRPFTSKEETECEQFLKGSSKGIWHFHGTWDRPDTIVFDSVDYTRVNIDQHFKLLLNALTVGGTTLVFIGCGDGMQDPTFAPLHEVLRKRFPHSPLQHFRLVTKGERDAVADEHRRGDPIQPLIYGTRHDDLIDYLASIPSRRREGVALPRRVRAHELVGREQEIKQLVQAICGDDPAPIFVGGPLLVGKSTVLGQALYDGAVEARYKARRFYVDCGTATTVVLITERLCTTLGREGDDELGLMDELASEPTLIVLDGAETLPDDDRADDFLHRLVDNPKITLVVAMRGKVPPIDVIWQRIQVKPFDKENRRRLFLRMTANKFAGDNALDDFLADTGGLPMVIRMAANWAHSYLEEDQGRPLEDGGRQMIGLSDLHARWNELMILETDPGRNKQEAMLAAAFEVTIKHRRVDPQANRLVSILGLMPEGIVVSELDKLFPGAWRALRVVREAEIADLEQGRLRMLAPLRTHVELRYPPSDDDLKSLIGYCVCIARTYGALLGKSEGFKAISRLTVERANFEKILSYGLNQETPTDSIIAVQDVAAVALYAGGSTMIDLLKKASLKAPDYSALLQADCMRRLGDIAHKRSRYSDAEAYFEKALSIYRSHDSHTLAAHCLLSLGEVALHRSDQKLEVLQLARKYLDQAHTLYVDEQERDGIANCLKRLGDVEFHLGLQDVTLRKDHWQTARTWYERAYSHYNEGGNRLGQANCLTALGDLERLALSPDKAKEHYGKAIGFYKDVSDLLGSGNCVKALGEVELESGNVAGAILAFSEALQHYERLQNGRCIANTQHALGRAEERRGALQQARLHYKEAWERYTTLGLSRSAAECSNNIAFTCLRDGSAREAASWLEAALGFAESIRDCRLSVTSKKGLADVAARSTSEKEMEEAIRRYHELLPSYDALADPLGKAYCLESLAATAEKLRRPDDAISAYQQAQDAFRSASKNANSGDCAIHIARIEQRRGDVRAARTSLSDALELLSGPADLLQRGRVYQALARLAESDDERARYISQARAAWEGVGRADLVDDLRQEFSDSERLMPHLSDET